MYYKLDFIEKYYSCLNTKQLVCTSKYDTELSDWRETRTVRVRSERLHGLRGDRVHIERIADAHAHAHVHAHPYAHAGAQSAAKHCILRLPLPRLDCLFL